MYQHGQYSPIGTLLIAVINLQELKLQNDISHSFSLPISYYKQIYLISYLSTIIFLIIYYKETWFAFYVGTFVDFSSRVI